jgi:hypothetical protein
MDLFAIIALILYRSMFISFLANMKPPASIAKALILQSHTIPNHPKHPDMVLQIPILVDLNLFPLPKKGTLSVVLKI